MDSTQQVITRFAPSPTGNLHIGGARTALFNWLFSKNKKGKFLLRIEDTDIQRSKDEYYDQIVSTLKWLEIYWDEEPYIQSKNIESHVNVANTLLNDRTDLHLQRLHEQVTWSSQSALETLTLMTNLGLENYFRSNDIKFYRANVGDRYVKEKMNTLKYNLGGEQSGHIILGNLATTGDGLLVALEVLSSLKNNVKASKVFSVFKKIPQILENIKVKNKNIIENKSLSAKINQIDKNLKQEGRLLVRKSGTENLIRIMVESSDKRLIKDTVNEVKKLILNYA